MPKYYYNGIPLKKYCQENNINYTTILNRINICNKKYSDKSLDEIVQLAINYKPYKYNYKGMSLKKYCEVNDIDYNIVISRLNMIKQKYPEKSDDEIVKITINYVPYKHNYKGMSLRKYCETNNIIYNRVLRNAQIIKSDNPDLTEEEVIEKAINYRKCKYSYNNMTLKEYCDKNGILYSKITNRIYKLQELYPEKSLDEIISLALEKDRNCKYYYKDMTLRKYCKNDSEYITVRRRLLNLTQKYGYIPVEELTMVALKEKTIKEVLVSNNIYKDLDIKENRLVKKSRHSK